MLSFLTLFVSQLHSVGPESSISFSDRRDLTARYEGPMCGIYSVVACLEAVGVDVSVNELWSSSYVSSARGSTLQDLLRAIQDNGAHGESYCDLGIEDLRQCKQPSLLHMRSATGSQYTHWVSCLGATGEVIRVFDPESGLDEWTAAEVLSRWDGCAILVSRNAKGKIEWHYLMTVFSLAMLIFFTLIARFYLHGKQNIRRWASPGVRLGVIFLAPCAIALLYHCIFDLGFFNNRLAIADVVSRYHVAQLEIVDFEYVARKCESPSFALVDARYSKDFDRMSLPNAVNLSINSGVGLHPNGVLLLPKLRRHFAEFLNHCYPIRLGILYPSTCVGLGYGHHMNSPLGFSWQHRIDDFP